MLNGIAGTGDIHVFSKYYGDYSGIEIPIQRQGGAGVGPTEGPREKSKNLQIGFR